MVGRVGTSARPTVPCSPCFFLRKALVMNGLGSLLNLAAGNHLTCVVSDFELTVAQRARIERQFHGAATKLRFVRAHGTDDVGSELEGVLDAHRDAYVSLQLLCHRHDTYARCARLFHGRSNVDMARLELPIARLGFQSAHVDYLLGVLEASDFHEQQRYSDAFFERLELRSPYTVEILTPGARLVVSGSGPWFQLAGPLTAGEIRILPGGEVAYTGDDVSGTFVVDGTLLATPQGTEAADDAAALQRLMRDVVGDPLTFTIERGRIVDVQSSGGLAARLRPLLSRPTYSKLVEVGVSFNRACRKLICDWPASSNEGFPGAHIGVGGDPAPDEPASKEALVHIDFISANARVLVNQRPFIVTREVLDGASLS